MPRPITKYKDDQGHLHRTDGPAIAHQNGNEFWFYHGQVHRTDGPAIIYNGTTQWHVNGVFCRCVDDFKMRADLSDEDMDFLILKYEFVET